MITWTAYLIICSIGVIIAGTIIGWIYVINIRGYAALFIVVMYTTYVIRPYLSYTFGEGLLILEPYLPGISLLLERNNLLIAITFAMALIFFALGYRIFSRKIYISTRVNTARNNPGNIVDQYSARFGILLIVMGYSSYLFAHRGFLGLGGGEVEYLITDSGTIFSNTTGYIEQANYLVVTGMLLYYASTRKLYLTLLMGAPWGINQVFFGYTRFMLIAASIGLMAVWLITREKTRKTNSQGVVVVGLAISLILLLILMRSNRLFMREGESLGTLLENFSTSRVDDSLGDFSGFEGTGFVIDTMVYRIPLYGSNIVYNLLIKPIPRFIWKGKILQRDFTLSNIFTNKPYSSQMFTKLGLSEDVWYRGPVRGSIGYSLEEWGWPGLFINFFFTGLILSWVCAQIIRKIDNNPSWIATYAAMYGLVTMLGRNDIFYLLTNHILLFFIPYAITNWYLNRYAYRSLEDDHSNNKQLIKGNMIV